MRLSKEAMEPAHAISIGTRLSVLDRSPVGFVAVGAIFFLLARMTEPARVTALSRRKGRKRSLG